jgi:cyclophilin family peptidyl-prolyl cis-trans isomerase
MKIMRKGILILVTLLLGLLMGCANSSTPQKAAPAPAPQPTAKTQKQWDKPPAMTINPQKSYQATISTNMGDITVDLFAKTAPQTVNNFVFLSKQHFYDQLIFHRIIKSFMIQTGDPNGNGSGGPGYSFPDELNTPYKYEKGIVAMANAGPNTNGSQFFICSGPDSQSLNAQPNYTIFGKVTAGMDTVDKIASVPVKAGPSGEESEPTEKVFIKTITITEK